jgi:predicted metal-dependent HD superfamily phosphohydrolase
VSREDLHAQLVISAFYDAYKACDLRPRVSRPVGELVDAYEDPPRAYHNISHAVDCVHAALQASLPEQAVLALFYHDAVYVVGRDDNEEESYELFASHFEPSGGGRGAETMARVRDLVLATKHVGDPRDEVEAVVRDVDVLVLAAEPRAFDAYDRTIRLEYASFTDADYEAGRRVFLTSLLAKDRIYYSAHYQHLEERARANVRRRLDEPSSSDPHVLLDHARPVDDHQ